MSKRNGLLTAAALLTSILVAGPNNALAKGLLFYSSVPRNLTEPLVQAFEKKNPGIAVTIFQSGTETLLEKMQLEIRGRGKPDADVVWIQDQTAMQRFADGGLLDQYTPVGADKIPDMYKDKNGFYTGTFATYVVLMYNSNQITGDSAPKRWADLADPKYKNKTAFADPSISGTGSVVVSALAQNLGWDFWEKVAKNKPMVMSGHPAMVSTVIAGERSIVPMENFSVIESQKQGQPVKYVFPAEGAIAVAAFGAVVHGTRAPEEARKFMDFLVSKDAASVLYDNNMYSTRVDAKAPGSWPAVGDIKVMPIDWTKYGQEKDKITENFLSLMGN